MIHIRKILEGCVSLLKAGSVPTEAQLKKALGLEPDVGVCSCIQSQGALLLNDGRCRATNSPVSVNLSYHKKRQIAVSLDEQNILTDADALMSLAPDVQVIHSKTGLGRAYVFDRDGFRCAVTVTNATNVVDGILCEAFPRKS